MPFVNNIFSLVPSYKATSGQQIQVAQHNPPLEDIGNAFNQILLLNGGKPMTGNLQLGGNKITGVAAATMASDVPRYDQVVKYTPYLNSMSGLTMGANEMVYATSSTTAAKTPLTAFARNLLDDNTAADARTTLGLQDGAMATDINQAVWNIGTATSLGVISPLKLDSKLTNYKNANDLGWGQSVGDVTASRAVGQTYTNDSGRPIYVYVSGAASSGGQSYLNVDGQALRFADNTGLTTFVVRPGGTYGISGSFNLIKWVELR